jgi:hypothetical protein
MHPYSFVLLWYVSDLDDDTLSFSNASGITTNSQGGIFEEESAAYLQRRFSVVCARTGAKLEAFETRDTGDFAQHDLDIFSYSVDDNGAALDSSPELGFYVLNPDGTVAKSRQDPVSSSSTTTRETSRQEQSGANQYFPATPDSKSLNKEEHSPEWDKLQAPRLSEPPTKYVVGEAYSGFTLQEIEHKVDQLEIRLALLHQRHDDRNRIRTEDITEAIFAALLVLPASKTSPLSVRLAHLVHYINERGYNHLARMICARRFVLVLVPAKSTPKYQLARGQATNNKLLQKILVKLDAIDERTYVFASAPPA